MKALNTQLLKKFLELASNQLNGEWLLVGGTLLPAIGIHVRATVDIDFIGLGDKERRQNLELMEIAEKLGLSIETINQAVDFFLRKVGHTKKDLIPLMIGKTATVYRPSLLLYWKLKTPRMSESDLADCKYYFQYCKQNGDSFSTKKLQDLIQSELENNHTHDQSQRLQDLIDFLQEP